MIITTSDLSIYCFVIHPILVLAFQMPTHFTSYCFKIFIVEQQTKEYSFGAGNTVWERTVWNTPSRTKRPLIVYC